jgi:internalin A
MNKNYQEALNLLNLDASQNYQKALVRIMDAKDNNKTELDLSDLLLSEIPKEVEKLNKLEILNLRNNKITYFPFISKLKNLKSLNLRDNQINDISFLKGANNLTSLDLRGNQIFDISCLEGLTNLESLNLNNNQIKDASFLRGLKNLTLLYLSDNQINDVLFLENLNNLTSLNIQNNKSRISYFHTLKNLTNLVLLNLSNSPIGYIPILTNLTNLSSLNLQNCQISDISFLKNMTNLSSLDLSDNRINNISTLSNLAKLKRLNLNNIGISDLSNLKNLTNLSFLNLSNNQIINISPLLPLIEKKITVKLDLISKGIIVKNNPLSTPPIETVKAGHKAILNYLKELEKQGEQRVNEVKMLIVGEGGSGKTSLAHRLAKDPNAELPKEEDTTRGIEIHRYDFTQANGEPFRVNIWDFGGQEIYHQTHQFFLTKRSLYVLVDDTRKDDKTVNDASFNYWLQVVELLSENSPLIIVQNEKGDRSKEIDLKGMQGQFGNIKDRYPTNLLTCRGLDEVKKAIEFHVQQLPHIGEVLPRQWANIRRRLEDLALDSDNISLVEYFRICGEHEIPERERALHLSRYLHDLGIFLHFQDDVALKNLFVLRNTWATDAVYKVLDNEKVKRQFGTFGVDDLDAIWQDDRYLGKQNELIALMKRFELCYELQNALKNAPNTEGGQFWLAPQLLPVEKPDFDWQMSGNLVLRYEYDFMPKGLLSRHIVRFNRYVTDTKLAWRSGVVMQRHETKAFIKETYGSQEIVIRVLGKEAKELMTLIAEDFDAMHSQYPGLRMRKMIPCNCDNCKKSDKPHYYDYKKLVERKQLGKRTIECGNPKFLDVEVESLLDGVFMAKPILDKDFVRELVEENKLDEAVKLLKTFLEKNEGSILLSNFNQIKKEINLGLESWGDGRTDNTRLKRAILEFLEGLN